MQQRTFFYQYVTTAAYVYGRFLETTQLRGNIETSGSSTTTVASSASGDGATPFDPVVVEDHLLVEYANPASNLRRRVTAKASQISLTVNTAWDLGTTGVPAKLLPFRFGAEVTDGWLYVGAWKNKLIKINIETLGSASVDLSIQGKMGNPDATPVDIVPAINYLAVGSESIVIAEDWVYIRCGLKGNTLGTDSVSVYFTGDPRAIGS